MIQPARERTGDSWSSLARKVRPPRSSAISTSALASLSRLSSRVGLLSTSAMQLDSSAWLAGLGARKPQPASFVGRAGSKLQLACGLRALSGAKLIINSPQTGRKLRNLPVVVLDALLADLRRIY